MAVAVTSSSAAAAVTSANAAGGAAAAAGGGGAGAGAEAYMDVFPRPPRRALDLYQDEAHMRMLSFGCPVLDGTFGGGLPGHGIVEISGMAGSGKTQLMLQLLIQQVKDAEDAWRAQNYATPFMAGRSFFLSTEGPLPAKRLADMAAAACPQDSGFAQRVLESVIIVEAKNVEDQLYILTAQLPQLLADSQLGIRLCVVDSMSALFRGEFTTTRNDTLDRARMIFAMAKQMKRLSHEHRLPFVVTNQVTADFTAGNNNAFLSAGAASVVSSEQAVQPALGLSWSNCVHTRFLLTRRGGGNNVDLGGGVTSQWARQMRLLMSPCLAPDASCRFVVEAVGVRGLPTEVKHEKGAYDAAAAAAAAMQQQQARS